jgi:hypothetical protein
MKMRTAGQVQRNGFAALAFILAFLAGGAALASDVERQIPMTRDTAGSGLTMEISREGTRQTATPFLALNNPSVQRIEDWIQKKTARLAANEIPSEATAEGSHPQICLTGTPREDSGRPETTLSSLPPVPKKITVGSVRGFLKRLRASRKEQPVPAVVVAAPEEHLGRTGAAPREAD